MFSSYLPDITLKDSIPFVRELANNVLLDVPFFMSGHRETMIQAVCSSEISIVDADGLESGVRRGVSTTQSTASTR